MDDQAFLEELKKDFFEEANALIQVSEDNILILEKDSTNNEAVNEIFRVFHTVKGGAASLELDRIAQFTHEVENLLDEIRMGKIKMGRDTFDTLLNSIDILRKFLELAQNDREPDDNLEKATLERVISIVQGKQEKTGDAAVEIKAPAKKIIKANINYHLSEYDKEFILKNKQSGKLIYDIYINLNSENPMKTVSGLQIYSILKEFGEIIKSSPDIDDLLDDQFSENLGFLFSTEVEKDFIKEKIFISDVTDYVDVTDFDISLEKDGFHAGHIPAKAVTLSSAEKNEIVNAINQGKNAYKIEVTFDDTNPMRSVSGVLFYSMLEGLGNVFKSNPTLEEFKQDIFHESGMFILISQQDTAYIKEKLFISDITKELKVFRFKEKDDIETTDASSTAEPQQSSYKPAEEKINTMNTLASSEKNDFDVHEFEKQSTTITVQKQDIQPEPVVKTEIPETIQLDNAMSTKTTQTGAAPTSSNAAKSSILRVESKRVDDLLNLVGELVISKASFFQVNDKISFVLDEFINQLSSYKKDIKMLNTMFISDESDLNTEENRHLIKQKIESLYSSLDKLTPTFKKTEDLLRSSTQSFGRLTNDLHESVMKLRMVPINQIFNRFPRLVRDLSKTLNKDIDLITRGEETELDKSLIEDLIDPLIHIVRNAVDHGIEPPEERTKKGKPRTGKLILEAEHEGQMISIRIKDDGKGLSRDKIRKKAIEKGLIDPKLEYSDNDINNLIFQPGFSTTDSISQVSGRGVGMDVVKQKVDSLNGTISIETIQDKGTTFTIKLPLTLAIIQALMVQVADLTYSIPINSVIETIRISPEEIELLENHEIIRVRDEVNSLIHLKEVFNHGTRTQADYYYVIIVGSEESKIGLVVDGLIGEQDVVIKPLNSKFATSEGIAGATILGDGRVSLIIDIPQLIKIIVNNRH